MNDINIYSPDPFLNQIRVYTGDEKNAKNCVISCLMKNMVHALARLTNFP
jgi:hypothetical protein